MTTQIHKIEDDFKEQFWQLTRTNLFEMEMDKVWSAIRSKASQAKEKSFLVCSSSLNEGNTTVTVGLGHFVAVHTGMDILIIDAHCKGNRPSDLFADGELVPLIQEPNGQYMLTFDEFETSIPNMRLLTFRNPSALETLLVNHKELAIFMDIVTRRYDYIFVDAPPLLDSNIAAFLARYLDKVIFVIASSTRPIPILKEALSRLENSRDRILGAVINKRNHPIPGYLYRLFG